MFLHWLAQVKENEEIGRRREDINIIIAELEQMERHVAPYAKLGCIERCCETLLKALGRVGADDLLPAVVSFIFSIIIFQKRKKSGLYFITARYTQ